MSDYPQWNDNEIDLLRRIANNSADLATASATDVSSIIAGTGINITPAGGTGAVTINVTPGIGVGDVIGPAAATNDALVRFDTTTGKLIQNSAVTMADTTGALTWAATQNALFTAGSSGASLTLGQGANGSITLTPTGTGTIVGLNYSNAGTGSDLTFTTSGSGAFRYINSAATGHFGINAISGGSRITMLGLWDSNCTINNNNGNAGTGFAIDITSGGAGINFVTRLAASAYDTVANLTKMRLASTGNLLIGLTTDGVGKIQLPVTTTSAGGITMGADVNIFRSGVTALTITTSATGIRFSGYAAGAITADASGNLTAVSDGRLKDIKRAFTRGLDEVLALNPIIFKWRKSSGMETEHEYAGFSAQEVKEVIPEAIGMGADGTLTFADRPVTAALVNAVKELTSRLTKLEHGS